MKACCKPRGLGDVVHMIAQPIAKAIDSIVGTHIAGCRGCARRREKINQFLEFKRARAANKARDPVLLTNSAQVPHIARHAKN